MAELKKEQREVSPEKEKLLESIRFFEQLGAALYEDQLERLYDRLSDFDPKPVRVAH